ncbi:MAG: hypothetical protein AB8I08_01470 [Sandaracinaceae bacterium]
MGLAALGLLLLLTRGASVADAALHLDTAEGLWVRGSTALTFDPGALVVTTEPLAGGLVYLDEDGVVRSSQSPGFALAALPFVVVGSELATRSGAAPLSTVLDPLFVDDGRSFRGLLRPLARDPRTIGLSLLGPLSGSATLVFVWLALAALGVPRRRRAWIAAALFVSPLGVYAGTCWTQSVNAAALAFATWRVVEAPRTEGASGWGAGVALALAVAVRPDHVLLVPAFALTVRDSPRRLAAVCLPVVLAAFGLWLHGLPRSAGGWSLETLAIGAPGLLVSPLTGVLIYAPFVALAPFGVTRSDPRLRWLLLVPLVQLVLYGGWFDWDATLALGPRFLVPSLPVLAVFAGLVPGSLLAGCCKTHFGASTGAIRRASAGSLLRNGSLPWLVAAGAAVNLPAHLLAHARVPETHEFFQPAFLDAWRTLLFSSDDAVGPALDCVSTYVPFYAWAALATATAGLLITRRRAPRAARAEPALPR